MLWPPAETGAGNSKSIEASAPPSLDHAREGELSHRVSSWLAGAEMPRPHSVYDNRGATRNCAESLCLRMPRTRQLAHVYDQRHMTLVYCCSLRWKWTPYIAWRRTRISVGCRAQLDASKGAFRQRQRLREFYRDLAVDLAIFSWRAARGRPPEAHCRCAGGPASPPPR